MLFFIKNSLAAITFLMIWISEEKPRVGRHGFPPTSWLLFPSPSPRTSSFPYSFFFKIIIIAFFLMWTIFFLKSLLNLLQYCFCFKFLFLGHKTCEILTPNQGSNLILCNRRQNLNHWTTWEVPPLTLAENLYFI